MGVETLKFNDNIVEGIMIKGFAIMLFTFLLVPDGSAQNADSPKKKYVPDDMGIYVEELPTNDTNADRYTLDNKVYIINRKFIFDYYIVRQGDTLKITTPKMSAPNSDFRHNWKFIPKKTKDEDKIETISITVLPGISNDSQTMLKYEYQYPFDPRYNTFSSTSGVIENEMNTWMHPPRDRYFMILELNPFPYIQQPFKVGNKWAWSLSIGDHWKDDRWKSWSGSIKNKYEYEITGKQKINTRLGKMDCWIVKSTATSSIGTTALMGYYNEVNGFVKLDYTNIDESNLVIEIREILN